MVSTNGGEILRVGTEFTIRWSFTHQHVQNGWDLWYSATGANGPWVPIRIGMPVSQLSLAWTVPDIVTSSLRFRIRQDNTPTSFEDVSDGDASIIPSLSGNVRQISILAAAAQTLSLDAGVANAARSYWVVGSMTGTNPGVPLGNFTVPIVFDLYTRLTVNAPNNVILASSFGTLDGQGKGQATFNTPRGRLAPYFIGITFYHAYFTFVGPTIHMVSNPVPVTYVL